MSDSSGQGKGPQRKSPPPLPAQARLLPRPQPGLLQLPRLPPPPKEKTPAPIAAPPQRTLREALGEQSFMNLVTAMRILFSSCRDIKQELLSVEGERIAYNGKDVASSSGDSITIPLAAFGEESEIYRCIRAHAAAGVLPGSTLEALDAAQVGRFIRVGPGGIELRCPEPLAPEARAQAASAGTESAAVSAARSAIESIDAGLKGKVKVCEEDGESRIYFSDLGWNAGRSAMCRAFLAAIGIDVSREYEGRLIFISASNEVFISCTESSVALCGAKGRCAKPSVLVQCLGREG